MLRTYDYWVLLSALTTFGFSAYIFFEIHPSLGLFSAICSVGVLCIGVYIKLVRIVHFVLYKNLTSHGVDNE